MTQYGGSLWCQNGCVQTLWRALFIATIAAVASAQDGISAVPSVRSSSNQTPAVRCDDVAKLDFRNLIIRTAQRTFAFHNGIAVNYELPPEQDAEHSQPDWKADITKDSTIQPASNVVVRFLLIHDSHETGSGWRYYATGLRCSGGTLQEVFHHDGLSMRIDRLDSTAISIGLNVTPSEPIRKYWSYSWDRNTSKYVLSSTQSSPR
jgi:hypothetical protein